MPHATLDVRMTGITEVVALLRAATDVVDHAADDTEAPGAWYQIVARGELASLRAAVRAFIPEPDDATVGGSQ